MFRFITKRLLIAIPTLLVIITAAFFMMRFAPGSPFDSERKLPPAIEKKVMAEYGLDKPVINQYFDYLGSLAKGDLGPSLKYKDKEVQDLIVEGFPVTATIGISALLLALVLGSVLGIFAALKQNSRGDYIVMGLAMIGICIPIFVIGPVLSIVFGVKLGWLPSAGLYRGEMRFTHLLLPVLTLALPYTAIISRLMRASMIEVLQSGYIRTAKAKGLSSVAVIRRHGLRAAVLPIVSFLGPAAAQVITGSLVIEQVFALPGIGREFVYGALGRDYTVVMGMVIVYASLIIAFNLLADILYGLLDPRVNYD